MTVVPCPHEQDVLAAILARRWPDACADELRAHAEHCEGCGEVALVAGVLRDDHDGALREARVPAAGQVWWRAAVRLRLEAAQAAGRPITWIQGVSGASAAGLTCAALGLAWPSLRGAFTWGFDRIAAFDPQFAAIAGLVGDTVLRTLPFGIAVAAGLVLTPIALYFALSDE